MKIGESILLCRETERNKVEQLIGSDLEPVSSCLIQGNGETLCSSMKRAILEVRTLMLNTRNFGLVSVNSSLGFTGNQRMKKDIQIKKAGYLRIIKIS
jgi:hypothetical protein